VKIDGEEKQLDPDNFDGIVLKHDRVFCPLHGEPFRAQYPKGVPIFTVKAFQTATGIEGVWSKAKELTGLAEPQVKALELVFDLKPICCWLSKGQLHALYVEANIGTARRCQVCNRKGLGTEYKTQQRDYSHLCFGCVCSASATSFNVQ
jgi:hypothetical protein